MRPGNSWCRMSIILVLAYFTVGFAGFMSPIDNAPSSRMPSCTSSEYHEFDFWVGDWDVFEVDNTRPTAHVRVDRILNDCVLREQYEDTDGLKGGELQHLRCGPQALAPNLGHKPWAIAHD
jgi:hypothetical protein